MCCCEYSVRIQSRITQHRCVVEWMCDHIDRYRTCHLACVMSSHTISNRIDTAPIICEERIFIVCANTTCVAQCSRYEPHFVHLDSQAALHSLKHTTSSLIMRTIIYKNPQ